jgi:hypothetical protein
VSRVTGAISILSLFFLGTAGCTTVSSKASINPHEGHQINNTSPTDHENHQINGTSSTDLDMNQHGNHSSPETTPQAKLTLPKSVTTESPISLRITVQNAQGQPIEAFETFQEQLMHLIIVSNDLQFFSHLHPVFEGNGQFTVETQFPYAGGYTLFSDYKPQGTSEQVSVLSTQVTGQSAPTPVVDMTRNTTVSDTQVHLSFDKPEVRADEAIEVQFDLRGTADNQPITDLQPYLGEQGHLVILKESSQFTRANYIHAHAIRKSDTEKIAFMTRFPEPGRYKLWGQFKRGGNIIVADFWVEVQPGTDSTHH